MNRTIGPKLHPSFLKRKEGVIPTPSNSKAGLETSASLTDNDLTRLNSCSPKDFYAESLSLRVATVLGAALSFNVSHRGTL